MIFVLCVYAALVYLIFFRFRCLPRNPFTVGTTVMIGVVLVLGVFTALRILTPGTVQAAVTTRIVEIAPQVSGRIDKVLVERSVIVEAGTPLFTIDPTLYQARVDELEARLELSKLRSAQFAELAEAKAGSEFQLQQVEAETRQIEATLAGARFDLDNTTVRAPTRGMVPRLFLKEGLQVSPSRSALAFMDTSELMVAGLYQQAALQNVKVGDLARVNFPALPGMVFETEVVAIPTAIGDAQLISSGQLNKVAEMQTTRLYPIYVALPEDVPVQVKRVGVAATVYIVTENAGAFGGVAAMLQWIGASLAILY